MLNAKQKTIQNCMQKMRMSCIRENYAKKQQQQQHISNDFGLIECFTIQILVYFFSSSCDI